jgi:hypothetical protein
MWDVTRAIHPSGQPLGGPVLDLCVVRIVVESRSGETGAQDVGRQSFESRLIGSINRRPTVNLKARWVPGAQPVGEVPAVANAIAMSVRRASR